MSTWENTPLEKTGEIMQRSKQAFQQWRKFSVRERIPYLVKLRHYLVEHLDEIAEIIAKDTGKPKVEAITADILTVVDSIHHMEKTAEKALKTRKVKTPIILIGKKSYVSYQPRGVVLVISPWNFPLQLSVIPMAGALIAGNSVVLKPSELTPMVGKRIEEIFMKVGFPAGLVQIAYGKGDLGAKLIDEAPDYIFFTGSVRTGRIIQQEAAKRLIPTTLELGGKDPTIIFADASIDRAVNGIIWGAMTNSGQACMSVERVYVERSIYNSFVEKLKHVVVCLKQNGREDDDIGSITVPNQLEIVSNQVRDAINKGAVLETGVHPDQWRPEDSLRVKPMILTSVNLEMTVMQEETFGPVVTVMAFDTEQEAIDLANDSVFGLNASVWSKDLEKAKRCADALLSGAVCINDVLISIANPYLPFGGVKESGIGRYHGEIGMHIFCHQKSMVIDKGKKKSEVNWFPYEGKYALFQRLLRHYFGRKKNMIGFLQAYLGLLKKSK